jgi:hypothetical protein
MIELNIKEYAEELGMQESQYAAMFERNDSTGLSVRVYLTHIWARGYCAAQGLPDPEKMILCMYDHKGCLHMVWKVRPSQKHLAAYYAAWESPIACENGDTITHELIETKEVSTELKLIAVSQATM